MRAAIYARVSTGQQNAEMQLSDLRALAQARGWTITKEYLDVESGAAKRRPELDQLMIDSKRRRHDLVLVWRFDRFARSVAHLLEALEEFKALGIQFVSYTEGIDTTTAMGKVIFTIIGAIAEFEREIIRERVRAGIHNAQAHGKKVGRPMVDVDPARIAALRAAGCSWNQIVKETGWGKGTCQRAISPCPKTSQKAFK